MLCFWAARVVISHAVGGKCNFPDVISSVNTWRYPCLITSRCVLSCGKVIYILTYSSTHYILCWFRCLSWFQHTHTLTCVLCVDYSCTSVISKNNIFRKQLWVNVDAYHCCNYLISFILLILLPQAVAILALVIILPSLCTAWYCYLSRRCKMF